MAERSARSGGGPSQPDLLDRIADESTNLLERLARDGESVERWYDHAVGQTASTCFSILDPEALGCAIADKTGRLIASSATFDRLRGERLVDAELCARASRLEHPLLASEHADGEGAVLCAYGSPRAARDWLLPARLAAKLAETPGSVAIVTSHTPRGDRLEAALRRFELTPVQSRICVAVIDHGDLKLAAAALGISYQTVRASFGEAMARIGARKLPQLVGEITRASFGLLASADAEPMLTDLWGLSARQAALAVLITHGLTRDAAAERLGISLPTAKKDLEQVYVALNITRAGELSRVLSGIAAASTVIAATGVAVPDVEGAPEPLRLLARPDGSRIAYSDYGPRGGRPVLIVHSSMTTRIAPSGLVRALQAEGYRPLAVDRPGFGLSDVRDDGPDADPFAAAARDAALLADHLRLPGIDLIARGGAQFVLALDRLRPGLIDCAILVNPDPHTDRDGRRSGPLGVFKELFFRNPRLIRATARLLAGRISRERIAHYLRRSLEGSPADMAALQRPDVVDDYFRSVRLFGAGKIEGYVAEQRALATGRAPAPLRGKHRWRVLIGQDDTLHDPAHVARYWGDILPDTPIELVASAGRLLALAQPARVVDALERARGLG